MTARLATARWRGLDAAFVVRSRQLCDLALDDPASPLLYQSIWRVRVGRLAPDLGAFVKLDETRTGLLKQERRASGETLIVQVRSLRGEGKADIVTTDIALPGRYLVYLPNATGFRTSRRGTNATPEVLAALAGAGLSGGIVRRTATGAPPEAIVAEAATLRQAWVELAGNPGMGLLKPGPTAAERLRVDYAVEELPMTDVGDDFTAFLDRLLHPRVDLGQSASVLIEHTAALTAIDVNTGTRSASEANALAAGEIARHIRVRNLSGLIMIDFASESAKPKREALLEMLRRALADDPAGCRVAGTTPSGLIELTRPRRTPPLWEMVRASAA